MITVNEVTTSSGLETFVRFPFTLFDGNPYWVPPLIKEEMEIFDPEKNPIFRHADARLFLAYKNGKPAGRIAAIVNHLEVEQQQKPKMRFGWFDAGDDLEVTRALVDKVSEIASEQDLEYMQGPTGFSNMDKAGLLIKGFEELNTMITWYNPPYYREHFEKLGFEKANEWVEYKIRIPGEGPSEKVSKFANLIMKRNDLHVVRFTSKREILEYTDEMFDLINKTYRGLDTYVPIQPDQIEYYKEKYIRYLHPDFIICVGDEEENLVAFAITMPSFARALQKANGSLWPFGWVHLLKSRYFNNRAAFYLIGIKPELQNKGITAIIFKEMNEVFNRHGITEVETNPELEDNKAVQALWNSYENTLHKRRRTYRKNI